MVAVHLISAVAHKETARQAILKQLREQGATSAQMPASLDIDGEDTQAALAELFAAGTVKEARARRYYLDDSKVKDPRVGNSFVALLALLVILSFTASLVALAVSRG